MSPRLKILIGLGAFWPGIHVLAFFFIAPSSVFLVPFQISELLFNLIYAVPAMIATALLIYFVVDLFVNNAGKKRIFWLSLLIFFNIIMLPIYGYLHIIQPKWYLRL